MAGARTTGRQLARHTTCHAICMHWLRLRYKKKTIQCARSCVRIAARKCFINKPHYRQYGSSAGMNRLDARPPDICMSVWCATFTEQ